MREDKILVIIPCYNEYERLKLKYFKQHLDSNKNHLFLFVDDGSSDGTIKKLNGLKIENPNQINVYALTKNKGKGRAIREAVINYCQYQNVDYVGFIDADLAIPLSQINKLYDSIKKSNKKIAITSRNKVSGVIKYKENPSFFRKTLSKISNLVIRNLFSINVTDTQCGCKLFSKEIIKELYDKPFISSWLFDLEILLRYNKLNFSPVQEVQLDRLNENSSSQFTKKDLFKLGIETIKIFFHYK